MPIINKVTHNEFTSELVIDEFQPADQATYKCVARNVYNDTVEKSTRICKSNGIDENFIIVVKHFFLAKLVVDDKKFRGMSLFLPSPCYLRFFVLRPVEIESETIKNYINRTKLYPNRFHRIRKRKEAVASL